MSYRSRPIQMICRVTQQEKESIELKMKQCGYKDFSKYARQMLLNGHNWVIDWKEIHKIGSRTYSIATAFHQIAERADSSGLQRSDIEYIKSQMDELIRLFRMILASFEKQDDLNTKYLAETEHAKAE